MSEEQQEIPNRLRNTLGWSVKIELCNNYKMIGGDRALARGRQLSALPVIPLLKEVIETTCTLLLPTPPSRLKNSNSKGREHEATLLVNS